MTSLLGREKTEFLLSLLEVAPIKGVFIEVGVFNGGSLMEIARKVAPRKVYGFDTFEGMPANTYYEDEFHKPGEFSAVLEDVKTYLKDFSNVELVKGIFPTTENVLSNQEIAFAHLDMDHWRGTLAALNFIWPRLVSGGVVLFDDYNWKHCPGIAPVVETWWTAHPDCYQQWVKDHQAVLKKA